MQPVLTLEKDFKEIDLIEERRGYKERVKMLRLLSKYIDHSRSFI